MVVHLQDPRDPLRLAGCACPQCDYDLKACRTCRCPECGLLFDLDDVRQRRAEHPETRITTGVASVGVTAVVAALLWMADQFLDLYWGGLIGLLMVGLAVVVLLIVWAYHLLL